MSLRGRIEDFKLTEILKLIQHEKKSGVLLLEDGENIGAILFKDGHVIFAFVGLGDIGQKLVNCREISPATLKYLRKIEQEGGKGIIKTIIEQNFIAKDKLQAFLERHTKEVLGDLLGWSEGDFDFGDQEGLIEDYSIGQRIHIKEAIEEASKKLAIWEEIKKIIPDSRAIISLSPDGTNDKNEIVLSKAEWKIISEVNGERSVSEIASNCGMDKLTVSKIIVELAKSRMVTISPYKPKKDKVANLTKSDHVIDEKVVHLVKEKISEELKPMQHDIGQVTGYTEKPVSESFIEDNKRKPKMISGSAGVLDGKPIETNQSKENKEKVYSRDKTVSDVIEFKPQDNKENKKSTEQDISKITENFKASKDIASISFALEELQLLNSGNKTKHYSKAINENQREDEEKVPVKESSEKLMNRFFKKK